MVPALGRCEDEKLLRTLQKSPKMVQTKGGSFWLHNSGECTCYSAALTPMCVNDGGNKMSAFILYIEILYACWKKTKNFYVILRAEPY